MIYELRVYHCVPGRLPNLLKRFETITLKIWEKHGIKQAGFWTVLCGESNQALYYLLAFDSLADREKKWNTFQSDPEWIAARRSSCPSVSRASPPAPVNPMAFPHAAVERCALLHARACSEYLRACTGSDAAGEIAGQARPPHGPFPWRAEAGGKAPTTPAAVRGPSYPQSGRRQLTMPLAGPPLRAGARRRA